MSQAPGTPSPSPAASTASPSRSRKRGSEPTGPSGGPTIKWIAAAVLLVIGVIVAVKFLPTVGESPSDVRRRLELKELRAAEGVQKEADALALSKLQDLVNRGQKAEEAITEFETELARWEREVLPLYTNDNGRALAAREDFALTFEAIMRRTRPTSKDASSMRAANSNLLEPIAAHVRSQDAAFMPGDAVKEQFEQQRASALAAIAAYRDAREQIQRMLTDAAASTSTSKNTLTEAIDVIKARTAAAEAAKSVAEQKKAEVAREERTEAERAKLRAEALAFAADEGNKSFLSPFFANGTSRFTRHGPDGTIGCRATGCTRFETPGPASLSDLVKNGVLDDHRSFLRAIHGYKGADDLFTYFCREDRPIFQTRIRPEREEELLSQFLGAKYYKEMPMVQRNAFRVFYETAFDALDSYCCTDNKDAFHQALTSAFSVLVDTIAKDMEQKLELRKKEKQFVDPLEKSLLSVVPKYRKECEDRLAKIRLYGEFWVEKGLLRP